MRRSNQGLGLAGRGARRKGTGRRGAQQIWLSRARSRCISGSFATDVRTSRKMLAACGSGGSVIR